MTALFGGRRSLCEQSALTNSRLADDLDDSRAALLELQ
jgi:hypothetical protein